MKKSIYLYLQRYLLKVLNKSCTYKKYNIALAAHPIKSHELKSQDPLIRNFLKNHYIKKSIGFDFDFSLFSSIYLVNQTSFVKTSQRHGFFSFSFLKNDNKNFNSTINSTIFIIIKGVQYLYKENVSGNYRCFHLITFLKLKKKNAKLVSNFMVCHKQNMCCYFQKNKKQNPLIFLESFKIQKINSFVLRSSCKSVLNLALFLSQQLSVNNEREVIYLNTLSYIVLPFQPITKNFRLFTTNAFLRDKTLILVTSLFQLAVKYVKKEKLIQFMEYKTFVYLVTRFNFYWFCKKNPAKVKNNSFVTQTVLTTTAINSYFYCLRPLFSLTRLDTFYICESLKLPIYPDQSNFRVDFLRNRVRKQILPAIRILLNPQFDTILCKFNEFSN